MSTLPTKKVVRTYSRQKRALYDDEPPTKRRRVEHTPISEIGVPTNRATSSPSSRTTSARDVPDASTSSPKTSSGIWSDEVPRSSPPSSPVPNSSPPPLQKRRPVFSFMKKQAKSFGSAKEPLSERSHNAQTQLKPPPPKKARMVQMQLDLASELRKACKTCGMEYIPSNAEDAALHRKFHAMNQGGVDFSKSTVARLRKNQIWSEGDGSFIAVVGRKDALALRNKISGVLKVVNSELAAVSISDEELWSQAAESDNTHAQREEGRTQTAQKRDVSAPAVDRFKTYLYIRGQKCIGACLVERIWEAYSVLEQDAAFAQHQRLRAESQSSSISISTTTNPVLLGVSRIWTSNQHRKQGIASSLLNCARSHFLYGITVEKEEVAFSQPTESGGNLARKWFGRQAGWHVYLD